MLCKLSQIAPKDLISEDINLFKGMLTENYIAQSLSLFYWKSKRDAEMDFIIKLDGNIIPLQVKASTNTKSKSLKTYMEKYSPSYAIKISAKNFGYTDKIKSIPLYTGFLLK